MSTAAVVTVVLVVLAVIVIAGYLSVIALALRRIDAALATVITSVEEIPYKTQPIPAIVDGVDKDLGDAAGLLEGLLQSKAAQARETAPPPGAGDPASSAVGPDNLW